MSTHHATRVVAVPSLYIGTPDASLTIDTLDGETASMALVVSGEIVALGDGFRVAEAGRWTWLDMPDAEIVSTFGAFLSSAVESSDDEAREAWPILTDEAADWTDALALHDEDPYGTCETCGDPIDYCQGHGDPIDVEESARMVCVVNGARFEWSGGEYIEVGYIATERGAYERDYGYAVGEFVAQDCINVWDHERDEPTIARTLEAFQARCVEYAREA